MFAGLTATALILPPDPAAPPAPVGTVDTPAPSPATSGPAAPTPSAATGTPPAATLPAGCPALPAGTTTVAVYYVGQTDAGPRLYREFHPAVAARGLCGPLDELFGGRPLDPDYRSMWPGSARVTRVDLGGAADRVRVEVSGVPGWPGALAVTELVWTVTGATGRAGVQLYLDGQPAAGGAVMRRGPADGTLAPVWLVEPQGGATVPGTVTVQIVGSVFEARATLRVRQGSQVGLVRGVPLSAAAPARGTGATSVTLPPGTYTVEAYEVSMQDGSAHYVDSHTVTVR